MIDVPALLKSYEKVYWTPKPGYAYVGFKDKRWQGPGSLARASPGAFNLYWLIATTNHPDVLHKYNEPLHLHLVALGEAEISGFPLKEWAVVLNPKEFCAWFKSCSPQLLSLLDSEPNYRNAITAIAACVEQRTQVEFTSLDKSSQPTTTTRSSK